MYKDVIKMLLFRLRSTAYGTNVPLLFPAFFDRDEDAYGYA